MQKIDDCKEIRLALTRAGIATRPEKCLQTFRLVVTAQYIYHRVHRDGIVVVERVEELPVLVGKRRMVHDVGGWRVQMLEIRPSRDALTRSRGLANRIARPRIASG
jgi:hypothetical protein